MKSNVVPGLDEFYVKSLVTDKKALIYQVEIASDLPKRCSFCKSTSLVKHGRRTEKLRDIPFSDKPTLLLISRRRQACKSCKKVALEPLYNRAEGFRLTPRLLRYLDRAARAESIAALSRKTGVSEKTIASVLKTVST